MNIAGGNPFTGIEASHRLRIGGVAHRVTLVSSYCQREEGQTYWWYDLELEADGGAMCCLEWDEDDGKFTLYGAPGMLNGIGITPADLDRFDDDEEGCIEYEGIAYYYEDSGHALCFEDCGPGECDDEDDAEDVYFYEFLDESGSLRINVERWTEATEVYLGAYIDGEMIEFI